MECLNATDELKLDPWELGLGGCNLGLSRRFQCPEDEVAARFFRHLAENLHLGNETAHSVSGRWHPVFYLDKEVQQPERPL
jgi:hypothetical protein